MPLGSALCLWSDSNDLDCRLQFRGLCERLFGQMMSEQHLCSHYDTRSDIMQLHHPVLLLSCYLVIALLLVACSPFAAPPTPTAVPTALAPATITPITLEPATLTPSLTPTPTAPMLFIPTPLPATPAASPTPKK